MSFILKPKLCYTVNLPFGLWEVDPVDGTQCVDERQSASHFDSENVVVKYFSQFFLPVLKSGIQIGYES